jgi:hypothetical protein
MKNVFNMYINIKSNYYINIFQVNNFITYYNKCIL